METPDPRIHRDLRASFLWFSSGVASLFIGMGGNAFVTYVSKGSLVTANLILNIGFAVAMGLFGVGVAQYVVAAVLALKWSMRQQQLRKTGALPEPEGPRTDPENPGRRRVVLGVVFTAIATLVWILRLYVRM